MALPPSSSFPAALLRPQRALLPLLALIGLLQGALAARAQTGSDATSGAVVIQAGSSARVARERLGAAGFTRLQLDANAYPDGSRELWWQTATDTCLSLAVDRRSALVTAAGPTRTSDCRRLLAKP